MNAVSARLASISARSFATARIMMGNSDVALLIRRGVLAGGSREESGLLAAATSRQRK